MALRTIAGSLAVAILSMALVGCNDTGQGQAGSGTKAKEQEKSHDDDKSKKKDDQKHDQNRDEKDSKKHDRPDKSESEKQSSESRTAAPPAAADPNAIAFYLSMHGASGSDTIVGVTDDGQLKGAAVHGVPADDQLHLLRGMCMLPDRSILVSNAFTNDTRVLRFGPLAADRTAAFASVLLQGGPANPALSHTYGVVVAPDGSVYCSNQDTNTVTRYTGPTSPTPGSPLSSPPSLSKVDGLAAGVFLPSEKSDKKSGLMDVRGITFGPDGLLYVADKGRHHVASYDPVSGERRAIVADEKHGIKNPIQIAFTPDGTSMFISDNGTNSVWRVNRATGAVSEFVSPKTPGLKAPSALLVDGDRLLVGSREGRAVISVRISDGQIADKPFLANLPDDPEFLLSVK